MSIALNDNIQTNAPKPADDRYFNRTDGLSPWNDVASVNAGIPVTQRHIGLTVNVGGVEYRYEAGVADGDLVVKTGGSGGGVTSYTITGDGVLSTFVVNHGLGRDTVMVEVVDPDTDHQSVYMDITRPDNNTITVSFPDPLPLNKEYLVYIM